MPITRLTTKEFLSLAQTFPVLDVRSPGEFAHARIPGAHSLPLFSDEERKIVGTAYKQQSKQRAIKIGLEFFGVKMLKMVEEVEAIAGNLETGPKNEKPTVLVHCWRGGMRSAGVAWLLDLYGYQVYTLVGGYKAYRNWVLQEFEKEYPIRLVGGYTGSGKTEVLHSLAKKGEKIIDLEALACHKGSAFGKLGQPEQPTQEMFENLLARELSKLSETAPEQFSWIEDESQRIGEVNIPTAFFKHMRSKKVYFLDIPFEERLNFIVNGYGKFEKEKLLNAIFRIKKRLGGLETKTAINFLIEDNIKDCFSVLLHYYDKFYLKSLHNRDNFSLLFNEITCEQVNPETNALTLLSFGNPNQAGVS